MKLRLEQLSGHLAKGLAPIYLLSGDEPLQLGEARDAVRSQARQAGFDGRELFCVDTGFNWGDFTLAADSYSLFGEAKFLDLRLAGKPDKDGAEALVRYGGNPPADTVLVVSLPKLTVADQKGRWFQALECKGVFLQTWPLDGQQLIGWLERRMGQKHLLADRSALTILAARVEGNLLAAAQEVEKLRILYGSTRISDDMMRRAVADSARYDVYDLAEAAMAGQIGRAHRVLSLLRSEGVAAAVALWALARDLRVVASAKALVETGVNLETALSRQREKLYDRRRSSIVNAAKRLDRRQAEQAVLLCAQADRVIKGAAVGDEWDALLQVCLCVAAHPLVLSGPI